MPYELSEQTIIAQPARSRQAQSGTSLMVIIPSPRCIVDGHSHIENGACAPLPLLWDKSWLIRGKTRKKIDDSSTKGIKGMLFSLLKGEAGPVQVMSTFDIGNRAVNDNEKAFAIDTPIGKSKLYGPPQGGPNARDFYSFLIVLMMDMEYGHISGLYGQTIYHEDETPWYYYKRQSGLLDENRGRKVLLPGENQKTFVKWRKQLRETIEATKVNPLRLFPMYFYAPQRWNASKNTNFNEHKYAGPWNYPFSQIATVKNKGIFLGFKMYNPLGSQPLDQRFPYLHDKSLEGDCFYARCEREGIPIMAHCAPGGMTTHELQYFLEHDSRQSRYPAANPLTPTDATTVAIDDEETAIHHFYDNYVHPKAWRKVLQKYPNLKLCLAHFGGDEFKKGLSSSWVTEILALTEEFPNVYTDFSCWDMADCKKTLGDLLTSVKHSPLRYKLIFGTDWYMTLVALGGKSYRSFSEDAWEAFMEIPDGERLWVNCTFLNPFTFYGFYDKDEQTGVSKLENIVAALNKEECDETTLKQNHSFFKRLQREYDELAMKRKKERGI
jgi:predicted TIM-barrel fold metal-dependent hydrolase